MDVSGYNRYELLFSDDESAAPPNLVAEVACKNNKSAKALVKKSADNISKNRSEKENKSGAINKNEVLSKKSDIETRAKLEKAPSNSLKKHNGTVNVPNDFKPQNDEEKTVVNFGYVREQRHFKDRDIRGPQRTRDGFRNGKREFDRQSGSDKTGVKSVDKRNGAGAHNWGSVKQEIEHVNNSTAEAADAADKDESSNEQTVEPIAEPEEVKEFTLDEWKASRGERVKPQYNIRMPNEGEDTSEWKKMVVLNKKKECSEEEYEYDPSLYPQRVGRLQRIVDIEINFKDGRRGGGFGRGHGRGFRPVVDNKGSRTEGDRQQRQKRNFGEKQQKRAAPNALKVDDERQFPTLN